MLQKDCIIILAAGLLADGSLSEIAQARVQKGVECYQKGMAPRILMTGAYPRSAALSSSSHSQRMKMYATSLGVPASHIFLEDRSRDTIGMAYFSKQFLDARNWYRVVIITSNFHIPRVHYSFEKVFGGKYRIDIIPSRSYLVQEDFLQRLESEANKMGLYRKLFDRVPDGDDGAIKEVLKTLGYEHV